MNAPLPPTLRRHLVLKAVCGVLSVGVGVGVGVGGVSGCLFSPAIEDDGYVECASDAECDPGRSCNLAVNLCAPPPWNDPGFAERQQINVTNPSARDLSPGTAVPILIALDGGDLNLDNVSADARFTDFIEDDGRWEVRGVFRDLFADRFVVWAPLVRPLPAGATDALVWLEQGTEAGTPTVLESPATTFALFDDLNAFPDDEVETDEIFIVAPGAATPLIGEGKVTVGDNVKVVWKQELLPPISLTFKARVNGLNCEEVFLGLTGGADVGFTLPSAGFFIDENLSTIAEVAPVEEANPTAFSPARIFSEQPNALHRFTIEVDGGAFRMLVDDVVFDEKSDLRPPYADDTPLFATVQVGGACSVDVETMWVSTLPIQRPTVNVEAPVLFNRTF